jgi:phosphoglycerol transferase MdoB-like AlkP superfamily enzyme
MKHYRQISKVEIINYLLPKQFQITVLATVFLLIVYTLLRFGFLVYNQPYFNDVPIELMMRAFVHGLRFDLSAIFMLNAVIFSLYNLPGYPARMHWFGNGLFLIFCMINLAGIFLTIADYPYYRLVFRRMTYEPLMMSREITTMLPNIAYEYWDLLLLFAAFSVVLIRTRKRFFSFFAARMTYRFNFFRDLTFLILLIGLIVLGIRGGLQSQPIRQSHAFFSNNYALGYIALNTPFNVILSLNQQSLQELTFLDETLSRQRLQAMLYRPNEHNIDPNYPFLRASLVQGSPQNHNVVILVMESWSAGHVGDLGASSATPFFDHLASEGLLFTNFMSCGQRSLEAIPAILASLPHVLNAPLIGSLSELNTFLGIGTIFSRHGYTTSFHHGAKTGSMGFDAYSRLAGFHHYYGMENFPHLTKADWDGTWGVYDHKFFLDALKRLNRFQTPFLSVIYSLSPHDPLTIPIDLQSIFVPFAHESKYRQVLRYSDYSLEQFFDQARRQAWFDNTVFIIVGDHPYDATHNHFRSTYHVPLLIYSPGFVKSGRDDRIASQVDILPTLLDLLQFPDIHASMGRSLLHPGEKRFAVVKYGTQYGLITDDYLFLSDLKDSDGLFAYRTDEMLSINLVNDWPDRTLQFKKQLLSYLQEATTAIKQDRICRKEDIQHHVR